jgi:transposase InsO family protein
MDDPTKGRPEEAGSGGEESRGVSEENPTEGVSVARLTGARVGGRSRALRKAEDQPGRVTGLTARDRLLMLDTWMRSKLAAEDFAAMVGVSRHTLYVWKRRFEEEGPAGLADKPRGREEGSRLPDATKRAILMMKQSHPEWGCERLRDLLMRVDGYGASASAIARLLHEEGYETEEVPTRPHAPVERRFERATPNQMWQSDLFTFVLKRENRRVYLVVFLDDHSRFVVGYGVHASASGALVREVFEAAVANFGAPEEVLTDNGTQYHTWRGKSEFTRLLEKRGVRHVVARPRHPETLGKTERFWGTLWRECLEAAIFQGLDDGRRRVGLFIDHYNFQRPHQGIEGLVPADRYFGAAPEVKQALRERVAANALDLARHGVPRKSFYLAGRVGEQTIALHGEGEKVILTKDGQREEVDLQAPGRRAEVGMEDALPEPVAVAGVPSSLPGTEDEAPLAPGTSALDGLLDEGGVR